MGHFAAQTLSLSSRDDCRHDHTLILSYPVVASLLSSKISFRIVRLLLEMPRMG
jgi:hypothetical protein